MKSLGERLSRTHKDINALAVMANAGKMLPPRLMASELLALCELVLELRAETRASIVALAEAAKVELPHAD